MDETDVKVAGQWKYLYRAVDGNDDAVDFQLRAKWGQTAACACAVKRITRSMLRFKSFRYARSSKQ